MPGSSWPPEQHRGGTTTQTENITKSALLRGSGHKNDNCAKEQNYIALFFSSDDNLKNAHSKCLTEHT